MYDKSNIICCNCGKRGHIHRNCKEAKTSVGIIAFIEDEKKYLLIRRKHSHGYVEFMRGKFKIDDISFIKRIVDEMTNKEKEEIMYKDFIYLWINIWNNPDITTYKKRQLNDFMIMKNKYNKLKRGIYVNNKLITIDKIIKESKTNWKEPEWGFPKGKRKLKENNIDCAIREFKEETGLQDVQFELISDKKTISEQFMGSNNVEYKNIYYLAKLKINKDYKFIIDKDNKDQFYEISKIGCYSYHKALQLIRSYNIEKKNVLTKINNELN